MNDDLQSVNEWLKFWKQNKSLGVPNETKILLKEPDPNATHHSFLIEIQRIDGILVFQKKLSIRVFMYFLDPVNKVVIGKGYNSEFIAINIQDDAKSYTHDPIQIAFHSKRYPINLVVEVVQYEKNWDDIFVSRDSLGYQSIQVFKQVGQPFLVQLINGTSRVLLQNILHASQPSKQSMKVHISQQSSAQPLSLLTEECCLIGLNEIVLGLEGKKILLNEQNKLVQMCSILVNGVIIEYPLEFDTQIAEAISSIARYKYKSFASKESTHSKIISKRLVVCAHNGWTTTNNKSLDNFVMLSEESNKNPSLSSLHYQKAGQEQIEINNIPIYNNQMGGVIILQLEIEVEIQLYNLNDAKENFIIGWAPIFIKDITQKQGMMEKFHLTLIQGPCKSINGRKCFTFNKTQFLDQEINVDIQFKMNEIKDFVRMPEKEKEKDTIPMNVSVMSASVMKERIQNVEVKREDEALVSMRFKLDDQQSQIAILETKIISQTKDQEIAVNQENEYNKKIELLREKENMYLKMVENLLEKQKNEEEKTSKHYYDLAVQIKEFEKKQQTFISNQNSSQQVNDSSVRKQVLIAPTDAQALLDNVYDSNYEIQMKKLKQTVHAEFVGNKKSRQIVLHILSIRPNLPMIAGNTKQEFKEQHLLASRLKFSINFYDLTTLHTENIVYEQDTQSLKIQYQSNQNLSLSKESFVHTKKEAVYNFKIDIESNQEESFVKYLLFKNMFIRVYDADTNFFIGYAQIQLTKLLLQGQTHKISHQESQIISMDSKICYGFLNVMVESIPEHGQVMIVDQATKSNGFSQTHKNDYRSSISPMEAKLYNTQSLTAKALDDDIYDNKKLRIEERIRNIKKTTKSTSTLSKTQLVSQINEQNKASLLQSVLKQNIKSINEVHLKVGEKTIMMLEFYNSSEGQQTYSIQINDPDWKHLDQNYECTIAHDDEDELKRCYSNFDLDYTTSANIQFSNYVKGSQQYSCTLIPDAKCVVFLKFQTFRTPTINPEEVKLDTYILTRDITVFIQNAQSLQTISSTIYKIIPHNLIIDMVFDFYEASNTQFDFQLPPLFQIAEYSKNKYPSLLCSRKNVTFAFNDASELQIQTKTENIGAVSQFCIFAYVDYLCMELLAVWQINIHCLQRVDQHLPIGQLTKGSLTIYSDKKRVVRIYSSQPNILWFESPYHQDVVLLEGTHTEIHYQVFSIINIKTNIIVNAVEINTSELIYSWAIKIKCPFTMVTQVLDVKARYRDQKVIKIPYLNPLNHVLNLCVSSSHPNILEVIQAEVVARSQETVYLRLSVSGSEDEANKEVQIFFYDNKMGINECFLIRIQYYN